MPSPRQGAVLDSEATKPRYSDSTEIIAGDPHNTPDDTGVSSEEKSPTDEEQTQAEKAKSDLSKIDRKALLELLSQDEDFKKEASKTVRQRDVETRAETRARELAAVETAAIRKELDLTRGQFNQLLAEIRAAQIEAMPEDKRPAELAKDELTSAKTELLGLKAELSKEREGKHRDALLQRAQTDWGLLEEDVEKLSKIESPAKFVDFALTRSAERIKELLKELETYRSKEEAAERVKSGQSAFAATAQSASGGEMSDEELTRQWLESDEPQKYADRIWDMYQRTGRL